MFCEGCVAPALAVRVWCVCRWYYRADGAGGFGDVRMERWTRRELADRDRVAEN